MPQPTRITRDRSVNGRKTVHSGHACHGWDRWRSRRAGRTRETFFASIPTLTPTISPKPCPTPRGRAEEVEVILDQR
jgi:hypothetical protein